MKLAFLISAHTDAAKLKRLVDAMPDDSVLFLHIDKKADINIFKQVFSDDSKWGSINEVEYQMELVRAALECREPFERLITISGMDYPVWSKEQIVQFFEQDREKEYLAAIDCSYPWHASAIYQQYFF